LVCGTGAVHQHDDEMGWVRIDNNKMTWCCYMTWASPLLIFSWMRSFPPKTAGRPGIGKLATWKRFVRFLNVTGVTFDERYVWD